MIRLNLPRGGIWLQTQRYLISGQVQGVGFRWTAVQIARHLGVTGTVQNLRSGQVAVVASGQPAQLTKFQAALRHPKGSPWIHVTDLTVTELPVQRFADFTVTI